MRQDTLFEAVELEGAIGNKFLSIIEEGVHKEIGLKEFAFLIKREEKQIRDALNGNGKYFSITWLSIFLPRAPLASKKLIDLFCDITNYQHPEPVKELTTEEELEVLRSFKADAVRLFGKYEIELPKKAF